MELKRYKLGDLVEVSRGTSLAGEFYATEGELIRLTLGNFDYQRGGFKHNTSKDNIYFSGKVKDEYILNEGDIITPLTEQTAGLLGSTARIPESGKYIQSQDVALIRCREDLLDPTFCYYLLPSASVKKQLGAAAQQTKIRHTTPDRIKEVIVDIPPLAEQKVIGMILDSITAKIDLNYSLNHYLEAMAKQLYDYWFVQFDFPDENGKPYKSSGGKMVWNDKLKREMPEGWKDVCFKDICNVKRGASPRPIDEYMDQSHNGIPWIKISDATSSESPFLTLVKEHIIPEGGRHSVHVSPNTLIVSNSASPGIPKFIEIDACVHDGWLILTGYKEYYRYYFYYIIHMIRHNLLHMASGSIFKNLKTDYLKEYVCLNPPQKVLQDYDKIVHPLMSSLLGKQLEIEELTKERDRLLALFMTGQVSVKQLNNDLPPTFIIIRKTSQI